VSLYETVESRRVSSRQAIKMIEAPTISIAIIYFRVSHSTRSRSKVRVELLANSPYGRSTISFFRSLLRVRSFALRDRPTDRLHVGCRTASRSQQSEGTRQFKTELKGSDACGRCPATGGSCGRDSAFVYIVSCRIRSMPRQRQQQQRNTAACCSSSSSSSCRYPSDSRHTRSENVIASSPAISRLFVDAGCSEHGRDYPTYRGMLVY